MRVLNLKEREIVFNFFSVLTFNNLALISIIQTFFVLKKKNVLRDNMFLTQCFEAQSISLGHKRNVAETKIFTTTSHL